LVSEDKLAATFRKAEKSLDEAERAREEGDTATFSRKIWEVGAHLEYLTFTMHLSLENRDDSWKEKLKTTREIDVDEEVAKIGSLLKELPSAISTDLEEAYRKAWLARGITLRIQKELEKPTRKNR